MGRDLFRRKALARLPLALLLIVPALVAGAEAGAADAAEAGAVLEGGRAPEGEPIEAAPQGGRQLRADMPRRPGERLPARPAPVRHPRSAPAEYGMTMPAHPTIDAWQDRYSSGRTAELAGALERSRLFRRHIGAQLAERGLPQELLFLPVLESHYRVRAVSRSGAVGLWQIMANTSGPLGLRRNFWLDERRDFWRSTDAALRKLQEDYRRFGSWPMALAAYNCGGSCLTRAIRAGGTTDFWELRAQGLLPRETAEYVPKFYALVRICSYPARHNLPLAPASTGISPAWARIELGRSVELGLVAQACGLPEELLAAGNAELDFGITPPPEQGFALKVPAEHEASVRAVLADERSELLRHQLHTVRTGDTFYGLARHYGVPVELVQSANPGVDPRRIRVGMVLRVPVVGGVLREPPVAQAVAAEDYSGRYVVQSGDTLWAVSRRYGTTPELLAAANGRGLDGLLQPGETLRVPGIEAPGSRDPAVEAAGTEAPGSNGPWGGSGE